MKTVWMVVSAGMTAAAALSACGGHGPAPPPSPPAAVPIGRSPEHRPRALTADTAHGRPVGRLRCSRDERPRFGVHVEVFASRQVVIVPAGIGIAPPHRGRPPYVRAGRCSYPVRTREPTGVLEVERGRRLTLGDLEALWGRRMNERYAWVGGRPWRGQPSAIPLTPHAQIVLSDDARVPVHASYVFASGL
jgi:hypothetical protein